MADESSGLRKKHWLSRWARALLATVLSLLAVAVGYWLKPSKPLATDITQPTVTIFASQPGVAAVVTMSAYPVSAALSDAARSASGLPATAHYEFQLSLRVVSAQAGPVTFVVLLSDFPHVLNRGLYRLRPAPPAGTAPAAGTTPAAGILGAELPVPAQDALGHSDYLAVRTFLPLSATAVKRRLSEPTVKIATMYSMVSRSAGAELQVAFPLVQDEKPAPVLSLPPGQAVSASEILAAYRSPPSVPGNYYEPDLEPGTTQYHGGSALNLTDYQTLAGTPPLIRPRGAWSWAAVSDVAILSQDALTADVAQDHLFWAGVAWGVAAAGVIAAVLELVSAAQEQGSARQERRAQRRLAQRPPRRCPPGVQHDAAAASRPRSEV